MFYTLSRFHTRLISHNIFRRHHIELPFQSQIRLVEESSDRGSALSTHEGSSRISSPPTRKRDHPRAKAECHISPPRTVFTPGKSHQPSHSTAQDVCTFPLARETSFRTSVLAVLSLLGCWEGADTLGEPHCPVCTHTVPCWIWIGTYMYAYHTIPYHTILYIRTCSSCTLCPGPYHRTVGICASKRENNTAASVRVAIRTGFASNSNTSCACARDARRIPSMPRAWKTTTTQKRPSPASRRVSYRRYRTVASTPTHTAGTGHLFLARQHLGARWAEAYRTPSRRNKTSSAREGASARGEGVAEFKAKA